MTRATFFPAPVVTVWVLLMVLVPAVALAQSPNASATGQGNGKGPGRGSGGGASAWEDHFDSDEVDAARWLKMSGSAPGYRADHRGFMLPGNVSVANGILTLSLFQQTATIDGQPGFHSYGGAIFTSETYGYGAYEWNMRMSSDQEDPTISAGNPVSGSVSAGFIYVDNSKTEIDFEFAASLPSTLWLVNWKNSTPSTDPAASDSTVTTWPAVGINNEFWTYKFVWDRRSISFYLNGNMVAYHTTNIPKAPAHFMISHWGSNNPNFGGTATTGIPRYFYVDWVRFTPQ